MYNAANADSQTKFKSPNALIREPIRLYQRARDVTPDPGSYQKVDESFCKNAQNITSLKRPDYFPVTPDQFVQSIVSSNQKKSRTNRNAVAAQNKTNFLSNKSVRLTEPDETTYDKDEPKARFKSNSRGFSKKKVSNYMKHTTSSNKKIDLTMQSFGAQSSKSINNQSLSIALKELENENLKMRKKLTQFKVKQQISEPNGPALSQNSSFSIQNFAMPKVIPKKKFLGNT